MAFFMVVMLHGDLQQHVSENIIIIREAAVTVVLY